MPTLNDIIVKAANGTTDVTYKAIQGATGTQPALFRNDGVGSIRAEHPTLLVKASDNGTGTARRVRVDFAWPLVTQDAGGNKKVTGRMSGEASVLIPQNQADTVIAEQAAQFSNLIASALVKASFSEGYGPRSA